MLLDIDWKLYFWLAHSIIGGWDAVMLRIEGQMILFRKSYHENYYFENSYYENYYSENSYLEFQ